MLRKLSLLLTLIVALAAHAQSPAADWKTIRTAHFRVHYPREYEAWATRVAERLESVRETVSKEVGYTPPQVIDVLVVNPVAEPNGSAWPLLDTPRMIFYAEPPGPDEQIGAFGHWIDLLSVHETTHLVHMLRPARNNLERLLESSVLPLGPITLAAPRWVLEGYATVIEGRLTGAGRPSSTMRALVLRRWAQGGRLPTYAQLDSDQRFLGMSMAYLMGSAYLEWLEQRAGADALRNLWARLTARRRRSFDEAFTGVFGESPERLYGRFVAELTASAMTIDRGAPLVEGALWQETPRASGDPAVSPDGSQLAAVLRENNKPPKLVIWSTGEPVEEEKKYAEELQKILSKDPQDVGPVRSKPLPRKAVHSLTMPDGGDIEKPRWTRDGKSILFAHRVQDAEGMLHFDLYRWDFKSLRRITHEADVRDADPLPDGRTAVAVRSRYGAKQLVDVDLTSGAVTPRTEASIDEVVTHPRVSPDGAHVAWSAHREGKWTLFVDGRALPLGGDAIAPEWESNDALIVTLSSAGFAELHRIVVSKDTTTPLTRTRGGAFDAAPSSDGRIFFTSLEPDGFVVRVLPRDAPAPAPLPPLEATLVPAIPPAAPAATLFTRGEVGAPRGYGIGRQEWAWMLGQNIGPGQHATEAAVRFGDVVGRLDTLIVGSYANDAAPRGAAIATMWRGWPVHIGVHAFTATDEDDGVELRGIYRREFPQSRLTLEGGALSDDFAFGSAAFNTHQMLGTNELSEGIRIEVEDHHQRGVVAASYRAGGLRIGARYQRDRGDALALGGLASSILPQSAYARRILDPALPLSVVTGNDYDGWRIETTLPSVPLTAFYQRHELGGTRLSVTGLVAELQSPPMPILKVPALDFTAGVARVLDAPLRGETKWWLGMRWRP
ncbi:MAG TPA: hypothetical protein VF824_18990 [Thermoanaerobaculia bacterium]